MKVLLTSIAALAVFSHAAVAWAASSVFLEELTTAELSAALRDGKTTIIITVGGTEQSGPHMALGKHNLRAKILAGKIATELGDTFVALASDPRAN